MYINDKYSADIIMTIVNNSGEIINLPQTDYCHEYEDTHGITLTDLRDILEDIFKKRGVIII